MTEEREQAIHPVVAECVQHNARASLSPLLSPPPPPKPSPNLPHHHTLIPPPPQTISNIRSLTASLFGVAAGILDLESYTGFLFYLLGTLFVSTLIYFLLAEGRPSRYFQSQFSGLWTADVFGGLSSFVLTWTLLYGLVRA